jgi:deazaflavin-dependent oxidoreductase (nitroreductase family)
MTMPDQDRDDDYQDQVVTEFRANGGKVGGYFADMTLLLLTTTGARSGKERINALTYMADGDQYVVSAGNAGRPANPGWYYNLVAHPNVILEVGTEKFDAIATVATDEERAALYERLASSQPQLADYQAKTTRQIPMISFRRKP